jgi:hypothetical protein
MAFEVGKRVIAESESTDRRPRSGVVEEVLRGDPLASLSDPLGRRSREQLHASDRRPSSWARSQAAQASGTTPALTDLRVTIDAPARQSRGRNLPAMVVRTSHPAGRAASKLGPRSERPS